MVSSVVVVFRFTLANVWSSGIVVCSSTTVIGYDKHSCAGSLGGQFNERLPVAI